MNPNHKLVCGY